MDKISRILPPSRRVMAMDVESNQPVRPGAPDYGRPTPGSIDIHDRISLSSLANNRTPEPATYNKNLKESARAKAVEEIADKFFNPKAYAKDSDSTLAEDTLQSLEHNANFRNVVLND